MVVERPTHQSKTNVKSQGKNRLPNSEGHRGLFPGASLVAQPVKNPPAMWETWVRSLGWEDPLEKGKATHFQYSGLEDSTDCIVHRVAESDTAE